MVSSTTHQTAHFNPRHPHPIRLGYIQLTDAAPLIVAAETGLFARLGLEVELSRELGWGSIHDRLALGELDFIHALGPMPLAASLGLGCLPCEAVGLMPLSYNGNAVTLSRRLWNDGVRSSEEFADFVKTEKWRRRFTLGVVAPASSHCFILRTWLRSIGLVPDRDLEIVNLPPGQFLRNLQAGTIDGACIGEPWNTYAAAEGLGWAVVSGSDVVGERMEKVLMTTRFLLDREPDLCARIVAAVLQAQRWCDDPTRRGDISRLLSLPPYLRIPSRMIAESLEASGTIPAAPRTGLHFGERKTPDFATDDLEWMEAGLRECALLDRTVGDGRFRLFRYYPSAVVKNAQSHLATLAAGDFPGFLSDRPGSHPVS